MMFKYFSKDRGWQSSQSPQRDMHLQFLRISPPEG